MTTVSLPDVLSFIVDNRGRTCPTSSSGLPLIATNCVRRGQRAPTFENVRYVDDKTYATWFRAHPEPEDVLFVCKGSPGRVAVVPGPVSFCIAQDMVALRADPKIIDPSYLYYRLTAPDVQSSIVNMHVGTMIPHFKKGDFGKLRFNIHASLAEQRAVAKVLGALDDKIAANERAIHVLADLQDVEVSRLVTRTAARVRLSAVATVTKGVSYRRDDLGPSESAMVTLKSIDRRGVFAPRGFKEYVGQARAEQVLNPGEIVVAQTDLTQGADVIGWAVRVPHIDRYVRLVASLDLAIVRPVTAVPNEYLLGALRQVSFRDHCRARMSGTTVLHLGRGAIEAYELPLPESAEMAAYAIASAARDAQSDSLSLESAKLAMARDELLPLLMSGRVDIKDGEHVVEGAL